MKQPQYIITTFSLIVALSGLSPVVMADAGRASGEERIHTEQSLSGGSKAYRLTPEQMDEVSAGRRDLGRYYLHLSTAICETVSCQLNYLWMAQQEFADGQP